MGWQQPEPYQQYVDRVRLEYEDADRGPCPECHGDGEVPMNPSRDLDPQQVEQVRCPVCHGEGVL